MSYLKYLICKSFLLFLKLNIKIILKSKIYDIKFFKMYNIFFTQVLTNRSFIFKDLLFDDFINNLRERLFNFFLFVLTVSFACKIAPNFLMFWEYQVDLYLKPYTPVPMNKFINDVWYHERLLHHLEYSYIYHTFDNRHMTVEQFIDYFTRRVLITETITNENFIKKLPVYCELLDKKELANLKLQHKAKAGEFEQIRLNEVRIKNARCDFVSFCMVIMLGVTCYKLLTMDTVSVLKTFFI